MMIMMRRSKSTTLNDDHDKDDDGVYIVSQAQEKVELKASDMVRFVLQTDSRGKERQAARITRSKVHPNLCHCLKTQSCFCPRASR